MASCIKLKLPGLDEQDVQLTKKQCINTTDATSNSAIAIITTTINAATTVTTINTMPKGMKVQFSGNFKWRRCTESQHAVCVQVAKKPFWQCLRNSFVCKVETRTTYIIKLEV